MKLFESLGVVYAANQLSIDSVFKLYNFSIDTGYSNRVYFDSNKIITATDATGFSVYGNTVSGIFINSGLTTGHYLTLGSNYTYWDNPTVEYDGTGNVTDLSSKALPIISRRYIANNLPQPSTSYSQSFYVTTTGSNSNDGLTEGNAFLTLTYALSQVNTNNWIIHVKAGTYSGESISSAANGYQGIITTNGVIQGYKTTIGDLNGVTLPYTYNTALDNTEYPVFDGGDRISTDFFNVYTDNYRIFRNFAVTNYRKGIYGDSTTARAGQVIENVVLKNLGDITSTGTGSSTGLGIALQSNTLTLEKARIKDCVVENATFVAIITKGNECAVINCKTYCNEVSVTDTSFATTDYYILQNGSRNVQYQTYSLRDTLTGHYGHTNDLKGDGGACQYNLVQECEAVNIYDCFGANYTNSQYNVFTGNLSRANVANRPSSTVSSAGLRWGNGANNNLWEYHTAYNVDQAISIQYNGEDGAGTDIATYNTVRNSVFYDVKTIIYGNTLSGNSSNPNNNTVDFCTFYNSDYMFRVVDSNTDLTFATSNVFKNCIFDSITTKESDFTENGWQFDYCNVYNSYTSSLGTNGLNVNPSFVDSGNGDFTPQNTALKAGTPITGIVVDYNKKYRHATTPTIGAIEI